MGALVATDWLPATPPMLGTTGIIPPERLGELEPLPIRVRMTVLSLVQHV